MDIVKVEDVLQWDEVDKIPGWLSKPEGIALFSYAFTSKSGIIEVGSYQGRSTVCLARGLKAIDTANELKVIAIDPHTGSPEHQVGAAQYEDETLDPFLQRVDTLRLFRRTLKTFDVEDKVIPVLATSSDAFDHFGLVADRIFIDANHDYEEVARDIIRWPKCLAMSRDSRLLVHDYTTWPGPKRAIDEACQREWELVEVIDSLAVLKRRAQW